MNKLLLVTLIAVASVCAPLEAYADESASTTPDIVLDQVEVFTSSSTPDTIPESATTSEPVGDPGHTPIPPVSITLSIMSQGGTLFEGPLTVAACPRFPNDQVEAVTGYCAVEQSGIATQWSWYGNDAFIDSLEGIANDYTANAYWNWFDDLSFGMTALNAHELHAEESLLITIGRLPLRVSLSPDALVVHSTTTVSVLQFGFDTNFNPVWEPAGESIVRIDAEPYHTDTNGTVSYVPSSVGAVTITATKEGYLQADSVTTQIEEATSTSTSNDTGNRSSHQPKEDPSDSARAFLLLYQHVDGSFASPLLTDWAALALKSAHAPLKSLKNYLATAPDSLKTATDFERRALAHMALGIDPQSMIAEIVKRFDGMQVGDPSLVNDDIFALIVLPHAGYTDTDAITQAVTAFVLSMQKPNGSWDTTDLTAAAVQALAQRTALPGVPEAIARARDYLVSSQQADGCFGNSFTTSWSSMAITALSESPDDWRSTQGVSVLDCLKSLQAADGGFEEGASADTRVWATAYALPALTGNTWSTLLGTYPKPLEAEDITTESVMPLLLPEEKATTTPEVLTDTLVLVPELPVPQTTKQYRSEPPKPALPAAAVLALPQEVPKERTSIWTFFADIATALFNGIHNLFSKNNGNASQR
jgi:hypothetical protein